MDEVLRKPTTLEAPPVKSSPDLTLVQEGGQASGAETMAEEESVEEVTASFPTSTEEEKPGIEVEPVPIRRRRRARKKKPVAVNPMALTKLEMMELDLNQARVDMQAAVLQNLQMKEKILNGEYIQQRDHLRVKQRDTAISMERCKEDYNNTRIAIQARLGISLDNCTVRQDGVVIPIDKDGNPEFIGEDV